MRRGENFLSITRLLRGGGGREGREGGMDNKIIYIFNMQVSSSAAEATDCLCVELFQRRRDTHGRSLGAC